MLDLWLDLQKIPISTFKTLLKESVEYSDRVNHNPGLSLMQLLDKYYEINLECAPAIYGVINLIFKLAAMRYLDRI